MVKLEINFLGGAGEVGRSAILLNGQKKIMLDYGVKVEDSIEYPIMVPEVAACVVSHAHLDHIGAVPLLYSQGIPVTFGTEPTRELGELLIDDSISIGRKTHNRPKFTRRDFKDMMNRFVPCSYEREFSIGDYSITLHDAGHIPGSAITELRHSRSDKVLAYTGDFKYSDQLLQNKAKVVKSDTLIMEATYGNSEHPDREELIKKFVQEVRETLDNGGTALVPSFAVGRAQELLVMFYKAGLIDKVYLDGMSREATQIIMNNREYLQNPGNLISAAKRCHWVKGKQDRDEALSGIIVTTAGMLNGGPVVDYITKINPASKIFLTGYQVEGTNGRKLMNGKPIRLEDHDFEVKNKMSFYNMSAHSDKSDLLEYVDKSSPETVICLHAEHENSDNLAQELREKGFTVHVPEVGDRLNIDF